MTLVDIERLNSAKVSLMARAKSLTLILTFFFASAIKSHAGFGFKLDGSLDKEAISKSYFEGDFGRVLPPLETYRLSFPSTATREDSIFVYKYLSVIYAADSSTKAKAESYMVQLVKLMPTIELIDLYISDNIQAIFKNVKENYLKQQKYVREHDIYGHPSDPPKPNRESNSSPESAKVGKSSNAIWWTAGGVAAAAIAGGIIYFVLNDEKPSEDRYKVKP